MGATLFTLQAVILGSRFPDESARSCSVSREMALCFLSSEWPPRCAPEMGQIDRLRHPRTGASQPNLAKRGARTSYYREDAMSKPFHDLLEVQRKEVLEALVAVGLDLSDFEWEPVDSLTIPDTHRWLTRSSPTWRCAAVRASACSAA